METNFTAGLPESFVGHTLGLCGPDGARWLARLPEIIRELAAVWSLRPGPHFPNLSYNYVAPCVRPDGSEAVLKIAPPAEDNEIQSEAEFLRRRMGRGAVSLLEIDQERRAILLEKLTPGRNLKEIRRNEETKAVEIAIETIKLISKKPPQEHPFRSLEDWFAGLEKARDGEFPAGIVRKTLRFVERSGLDSDRVLVLHGDLHHENILSAERAPYLAIDPKGVVGHLGYEIAVFLNNHLWWLAGEPGLKDKLNEAVRRFSEAFRIAPEDLRRWAFSQIVLSAWWSCEENNKNWKKELAFAEIWEV